MPECAARAGSFLRRALLACVLCACSSEPAGEGAGTGGDAGGSKGLAGSTAGDVSASGASGGTGGPSAGRGSDAGSGGTTTVQVGGAGTPAAGSGGSSGSAGSTSTADAGVAEDGYCPGTELPAILTGQRLCMSDAECAAFGPNLACMIAPPAFCGGMPPTAECFLDMDCGAGRICVTTSQCGHRECQDGCTEDSCNSGSRCEAGRCVPLPCGEQAALGCGFDFICNPASSNADARGCVATSCHDGSYTCPPTTRCGADGADVHGCVQQACSTAAQCECGSCIGGVCRQHPGACYSTVAPP